MGDLVEVNQTRLFVDDRGPRTGSAGSPVLFIHGGPGAACWDFMTAVGDRLAAAGVRIIGVDQRGIGRSDPLPRTAPPVTVPALIADFEALREHLGLHEWTILGHSAGGGYALDYAITYPDRITGVIFDCPCWDRDDTDRRRLPFAADLLDARGEHDAAELCRADAARPGRLTHSDSRTAAMHALGSETLRLSTHDRTTRRLFEALWADAPRELDDDRDDAHLPLLKDMYRDRTPDLVHLSCPSMLIHGETDLVVTPRMIDAYQHLVDAPHRVLTIPGANHFAYVEQPDAYVHALTTHLQPAKVAGRQWSRSEFPLMSMTGG